MAHAYAYAEGEATSPEIKLANAIDRFGGMAVYGRTVGAVEMREIALAESVVDAHRDRGGKDKEEWSRENKAKADLLGLSLRAALDLGLIDE